MIRILSNLILVLYLSLSVFSANAASYTFTILDSLGGTYSRANDINNAGQIVGYSLNGEGLSHATLWANNSITNLNISGESYSVANSINNLGQIVGSSQKFDENYFTLSTATLWSGGKVTKLGAMSNQLSSGANSINDSGLIVGSYFTSDSPQSSHAVLWDKNIPTDLSGSEGSNALNINNAGLIVGYSASYSTEYGSNLTGATLWDGQITKDLAPSGNIFSAARSINDSGQIVGNSQTATIFISRATAWNDSFSSYLGITNSNGISSYAWDINNNGQIVGSLEDLNFSQDGVGRQTAVVWNNGILTDLNNLVDSSITQSGWHLSVASAINDNGMIVGSAANIITGEGRAFLLAPVPEPETFTMFIAGLGLLGLIRLRRKIS